MARPPRSEEGGRKVFWVWSFWHFIFHGTGWRPMRAFEGVRREN